MAKTTSGGNGVLRTERNPFAPNNNGNPLRCRLDGVEGWVPAIQAVVDAGAAIIIGGTRDGGAYSITVLDGEDRHRTFVHTRDEAHAAVQALLQLYA